MGGRLVLARVRASSRSRWRARRKCGWGGRTSVKPRCRESCRASREVYADGDNPCSPLAPRPDRGDCSIYTRREHPRCDVRHNAGQRPAENSACTPSSTDLRCGAVPTYLIVQQIELSFLAATHYDEPVNREALRGYAASPGGSINHGARIFSGLTISTSTRQPRKGRIPAMAIVAAVHGFAGSRVRRTCLGAT